MQDQPAMSDLWDQRATLGLQDLRGHKAIRDLMAKKDLLGLMVYRESQVYKGLQDPQGPQAAMGQMEMMDILAFLGPMAMMDFQVHLVCLDQRVNPRDLCMHHEGHLDLLGGTVSRVTQGFLEHKGDQATLDHRALSGFLVVQGLQERRVKKA